MTNIAMERSTIFLMGKSTISMAIFNSEPLNYQRVLKKCFFGCMFFDVFCFNPSVCGFDSQGLVDEISSLVC